MRVEKISPHRMRSVNRTYIEYGGNVMGMFFGIMGVLAFVIGIILLIIFLVLKMKLKVVFWLMGIGFLMLILGIAMIPSSNDDRLKSENASLKIENSQLKEANIGLTKDIEVLESKLDEAKVWFELSDIEKDKKIAELKIVEEEKRVEDERLAEEKRLEEARIAEELRLNQEAEEKMGYETGINYYDLARQPDMYKDEKVKLWGRIIQVMEDTGSNQLRLTVNDDYEMVVYCEYDPDLIDYRLLEEDMITIYGTSYGLYSYESVMGGKITLPAIIIDKIEQSY